MKLLSGLLLFASLFNSAFSSCEDDPEECSNSENHFHFDIRKGFCVGDGYGQWMKRYVGAESIGRFGHAMSSISGSMFIVQGGKTKEGAVSDATFCISDDSRKYTSLTSLSSARYYHQALVLDDTLYVHGGTDDKTIFGDIWRLPLNAEPLDDSISSGKWTLFWPGRDDTRRQQHSMLLWNRKFVIFGGFNRDQPQAKDSVNLFDPATKTWSVLASGTIPGRFGHGAAIEGDNLYVYGGQGAAQFHTDLWVFSLVQGDWKRISRQGPQASGASLAFMQHCNSLVLFGGQTQSLDFRQDVATFDIDSDEATWQTRNSNNNDLARADHAALASGSRMFIFGGRKGTQGNTQVESALWEWM